MSLSTTVGYSSSSTDAAPSTSPSSTSSSTATAGGAGGQGAAPAGMVTNDQIVYWFDIALLCVLGFFFLSALPRAYARFSRVAEWGRGFLLLSGTSSSSSRPVGQGRLQGPYTEMPAERMRRQRTDASQWDYTTEQSHTVAVSVEKGVISKLGANRNSQPPPHVPSWSTILYPVSAIFAYNVAFGKSIGKLTVALLFVVTVIALQFAWDGNPMTQSVRPGWFAAALIPVVFAFGMKNNLIGMLLGMGYEKLNFLHRWVGIITFVAANVHAIGFLYKWSLNGNLSQLIQLDFAIHGVIALTGIELLFFASLSWVRNRAYVFFLFSHVVGFTMFLAALCLHQEAAVKWVLLAVFIYAFDHVLRLVKTRISVARIKTVPELGIVRIEIPSLNRGWRAGQHVRLRILSTEVGWVGWSVAHPFTIANAPGNESADKKGLVLMVKKCGRWTGKLYDAAGRAGYYPTENGYGTIREMRVIIEGPYGGLGHMMMTSFSSAMLVGGGSGITFVLSQAEELVQAVRAGTSSLRFIELVWITQDQASISPLLSTFSALIDGVSSLPGILFKISIYYSRASSPRAATSRSSPSYESIQAYLATLSPTLKVHAGRPASSKILDGLVRLTAALGPGRAKGVAVGVCGPVELVGEVRRYVWSVKGDVRRKCGGVELHEEFFGW